MDAMQEIRVTREAAEEKVALGDALNRLTKNRDFKKIIDKGYFEQEAARLALISADFSLNEEARAATLEAIKGISHFHQYLQQVSWFAVQAQATLDDLVEHELEVEAEADAV